MDKYISILHPSSPNRFTLPGRQGEFTDAIVGEAHTKVRETLVELVVTSLCCSPLPPRIESAGSQLVPLSVVDW